MRRVRSTGYVGLPVKNICSMLFTSGLKKFASVVRPSGIVGLTPKSVRKKLKDKSFAAAVDREDVRTSAEELGLEFDEHVAFVIAAIEERAAVLGLDGTPTAAQ